jgi:Tfp pilus assembly protein PilO
MKLEIRERDRRALIGLVLAASLYGVIQFVAIPAYDRFAIAADTAADRESQLRRYRRAQLRKGQYAELTKVAAARVTENDSIVIAGTSESLASAELQTLIEATGAKVGLMLSQRSTGALRRINEFYAELPMTLGFESTPGQLVMFLAELRGLPRFVTVRSLQVSPVQPIQEAPKGGDMSKNVRVSMTIAAVSRAGAVKK